MAARDTERRQNMQSAERKSCASAPERSGRPVRTVQAAELLGAGCMLRIELNGELYTLRLTRNHRLILTK